jgi:hypothetical protein
LALGTGPAAFAALPTAEAPISPPPVRVRRRSGARSCFLPALLLVATGVGMLNATSHRRHPCATAVDRFPAEVRDDPFAAEPAEPDPLGARQDFATGRSGPPWIAGWDARAAAAGQTVTIRGNGFSGAQHILFVAGPSARTGAAHADAEFDVLDDFTIEAVVPDLGRGARDVTVAVITPAGAAVTVPMDESAPPAGLFGGFVTVPGGQTLMPRRGTTLLVERGGCAASASDSVIFLRAGAGLDRVRNDCLIIRETPNPVAHDLSVTPVIEVPELRTCRVDSLFHYAGRW